ncbi:uncharacterized protein LOC130655767 isoform X4 [Hydractinia symbiolongicarpus]|uniref:uncharacterized protein LOC130655767 isoform X4 n=1 Tax=Hydractinia symbiolongicarpus TaxID=13093 RepID=UPI00254F1ACF|nr:uncharacterized protein LOC130655767 isoform X4 [Hydractinia symbiolongicarpus]
MEHNWKHRKPPDTAVESQLMLCIMPQPCIFGDSCLHAHSESELAEWKTRLNMETKSEPYSEDSGPSLENLRLDIVKRLDATDENYSRNSVLAELIGGYSILCNENMFIMHVDKDKELNWVFTITCHRDNQEKRLERIYFLNDYPEFAMEYVFFTQKDFIKLPTGCKVWKNKNRNFRSIKILLKFCAKRYGNYWQEVIFDFGGYPKVTRKLGVQVATEESLQQTMKYNPSKHENNELSWLEKHKVICFDGSVSPGLNNVNYPLPHNIENLVVFDAFKHLDAQLTKQNYRMRLHTLLYIEEYERRANLQRITFHLEDLAVCIKTPKSKDTDSWIAEIIFDEHVLEDLVRLVGKTGPFGAGKTRTLANVVERLIKDKATENRVLICTRSNSAADHYIEEYFHPFQSLRQNVNDIDPRLIPLRVNWEYRYIEAVSDTVLAYCSQDKSTGLFCMPSKEDLDKHAIVISTLFTSYMLSEMELPKGYFTHIIIDEAAQAMEVEAIIPFLLATKTTKIVLAGDHMQMSEALSSIVAKDLGLGTSLLERLFQRYPFDAECKLKLLENFRSYKEIVELASHMFYEDSLVSNKIKADHNKFPVEFHGVKGVETLSKENPSYENVAEATEILLLIRNIVKVWSDKDVQFNLSSICVVSFYPGQVRRVRKTLRRNKMAHVRVESVNNIQGLEFDVLIISTVRTHCEATIFDDSMMKDMGFLSNPKLLNTAITRARFQVIMVGDPIALCMFGQCVPCWKTILRVCNENLTFTYADTYEEFLVSLKKLTAENVEGSVVSESYDFDETTEKVLNDTDKIDPSNEQHGSASQISQDLKSEQSHPPLLSSPFLDDNTSPLMQTAYEPPLFYDNQFGYSGDPNTHVPPIRFIPPRSFIHARHQLINRPFYHGHFHAFNPRLHYPHAPFAVYRGMFGPAGHQQHRMNYCQNRFENRFQFFYGNTISPFTHLNRFLPRATNIVNLQQKIHFIEEYCTYLLNSFGASLEVKNHLRNRIKNVTTEAQILSDYQDTSDPTYLHMAFSQIESQIENIYLFRENEYIEYIKATGNIDLLKTRELKKEYDVLKTRFSDVEVFLVHEYYRKDALSKCKETKELGDALASFSYLIQLVGNEFEVSFRLMNTNSTEVLLPRKLEFIKQQLYVLEANRDQLEERINVQRVEVTEKDVCVQTSQYHQQVDPVSKNLAVGNEVIVLPKLFGEHLTDCDIGALENKLAAITVEDQDPDLVEWFKGRRNDPCVKEYVTTHARQQAERVPSPSPSDNTTEKNSPRRCRRRMRRRKRCVGEREKCFSHPRENNGESDYMMVPPYSPYIDDNVLSQRNHIFKGKIEYRQTDNYRTIHGSVYIENGVQVHINGLRRNNRALSGDTVLVSCKIVKNVFDVPGEVVKVIKRKSLDYNCKRVNTDLVQPVGVFGPAILIVRGVGSEKRILVEDHVYGVKIIDWPEKMMFPLGEIVRI